MGLFRMLDRQELPVEVLHTRVIHRIKDLIHAHWRNYRYPLEKVHYCQATTMHHEEVEQVMEDITIVKHYQSAPASHEKGLLTTLVHRYNEGVAKAATTDDLLENLARLLRELAWLHPLADKNSRSRMMLLNYELRRLNIACGAMLWNYNKNIYFETLNTTIARIKEGIQVFQEASQEGFAENPWSRQATIDRHFELIPLRDTDGDLLHCWLKFCTGQPNKELEHEEKKQLEIHD